MKHIIFVFSIIALAMLFGCSNSHSPISTGADFSDGIPAAYTADYQSTINGESYDFGNQTMIGAFQMIANHETHEIEVVPVNARTAMAHYNITSFLMEPYCPIQKCWYVNVLYYDPVEEVYEAEIAVYNPTPYTGYDVRVLFVELFDTDIDPETEELYTANDIIILNPDGWTKICDDEEEEPEMNPFILFNKEQVPSEWIPNPTRSFPPYSIDYEYVVLRYPSLAPAGTNLYHSGIVPRSGGGSDSVPPCRTTTADGPNSDRIQLCPLQHIRPSGRGPRYARLSILPGHSWA